MKSAPNGTNGTARWRVDIISDTHGYLSSELVEHLEGADAIMHAGDICSPSDLEQLKGIAPTYAVLGNNDWPDDYARASEACSECPLRKNVEIKLFGLTWEICHYREHLNMDRCDVAICGHTHCSYIERVSDDMLLINPGSPTRPRSTIGPTFARVYVGEGGIVNADIVQLPVKKRGGWWAFPFLR